MHLTCAHQNVPFVHQVRIRKNLAKVVAVLVNQEHTQAMEQHFAKNVCLELVQINLMVLLLVLLALLDIMQVRDIHLVINARQDIILYLINRNVKSAKRGHILIRVQLLVLYAKLVLIPIMMGLRVVIIVEVTLIPVLVLLLVKHAENILMLIKIILNVYHALKEKF
jgi:hypothetical protein